MFSLAWIGYLVVGYKKKSYGYFLLAVIAFSAGYRELKGMLSSEYLIYANIIRVIIGGCMISSFVYYSCKEKLKESNVVS